MSEKPKSWCPLPWMHQALRNNGDFRVCCQANSSLSRGLLNRSDGRVMSAKDSDLHEARNSVDLKLIRKQMLEGVWPESCMRCEREEESGIRSRRTYETELWGQHVSYEDARELTASDGSIDIQKFPTRYWDLRFGNHCNLKCRMCGPSDSHSWYSDFHAMGINEFKDTHGTIELEANERGIVKAKDDPYTWYESNDFWDQLYGQIESIEHVYLVGGEPLLIHQHYDFLNELVERGRAPFVTLEYNTNLSIVPEKALKLWEHFKKVKLGVSLDGVGPINDYIRHPSKWSVMERNLLKIDKAPGNIDVWLAPTIQILNVMHLPEMIKWKMERQFKRINSNSSKPFVTTHLLHRPEFYNIRTLPPSYKLLVEKEYTEFYSWLQDWMSDNSFSEKKRTQFMDVAKSLLGGFLKYMNQEDWSGKHLSQFLTVTNQIDQIRSESLETVSPLLYEHVIEELKKQGSNTVRQLG